MPYNSKWDAEKAVRSNKDLVLVPIVDSQSVKWDALPRHQADPIIKKIRSDIGTLNIELRKVQYAAFASEDSNCFTADVYVNGKKEGRAHNEGFGGPTSVDPHSLSTQLDVYGATLPMAVSDIEDKDDPTGYFTYQPDAENIVDDLFEKHLEAIEQEKERKKFKRDLAKRILYIKHGQKGVFQTATLEPATLAAWIARPDLKEKLKGAEHILNLMPLDEAFALFNANIKRVYR